MRRTSSGSRRAGGGSSRGSAAKVRGGAAARGLGAAAAERAAEDGGGGGGEGPEDEDEFLLEMLELEGLCRHLNLRCVDETAEADDRSGGGSGGGRPPTGLSSASVSTTVPGGSSGGGEAASADGLDEPPLALASSSSVAVSAEATSSDWGGSCTGGLNDDPFDALRGAPRAHYELSNIALPQGCRIESSPGSRAQFFFTVDVGEGPYTPATLTFWIKIFDEFPAEGSFSVRSTKRIFHPSVDPETRHVGIPQVDLEGGDACRQLGALLVAIRRRVCSPTDAPAMNAEAAMLLQTDPEEFRRTVRLTLGGGEHRGVQFDRVLGSTKTPTKGKARDSAQPSPPLAVQRSCSSSTVAADELQVEMMKLEVLGDQVKASVNAMIQENTMQCRNLEMMPAVSSTPTAPPAKALPAAALPPPPQEEVSGRSRQKTKSGAEGAEGAEAGEQGPPLSLLEEEELDAEVRLEIEAVQEAAARSRRRLRAAFALARGEQPEEAPP